VEIVPIFLPNSGIQKNDLPAPVREFIDADGNGIAYVVDWKTFTLNVTATSFWTFSVSNEKPTRAAGNSTESFS